MNTFEKHFLVNYSYVTYVYIVSKLEKYNQLINEKYSEINPPLYNQALSQFNDNVIEKILNSEYLDHNKLQCISMMVEYMLYLTSKNIDVGEKNKRYDFLNYFMKNVDKILPNMIHKKFDSVHGYVVFSDFITVKNKIVIKTPKDEDEIRNMMFEYYIGSRFINKLRTKTPNFMYTYGIFMCNPLIAVTKENDKDKISTTVNFCYGNDKKNIYLLFEKIDGVNLHNYIQTIKNETEFDDLINYVIQIILSLDIAQKEGQYSHNDLHTDNIMLRTLSTPITHEYLIGKYKYKMELKNIATIIDYGMNRFVENDIPLGVTVSSTYNMYPYKNTTAIDVFKVLITSIFSIVVLCHKNEKIYKKYNNKIDETIEFLISFFRDRYNHIIIKHWDEHLVSKTLNSFNIFKDSFFKMKDTYYYPLNQDYIFYNIFTPENLIEHIRVHMPDIWKKNVTETIIDKNEMLKVYTRTFNPKYDSEEYDDYLFSENYKSIYFSDFIEQNKLFYNLFNKNLNNKFSEECLVDDDSMIINFNNIKDCKKIISLFPKNQSYIDMIDKFENFNIKNIKKNYQNDVATIVYYMKEMDNIYSTIDTNLFKLYKNPKYIKISMEIMNEEMKKQITKMYDYLKIFEKYLLLSTYSLDLKDVADMYLSNHKYNFSLFEPSMKYYENSINISNCIKIYNQIIYEYYSLKINEETEKSKVNVYNLYNLIVVLQNLNPHYSDFFDKYIKSFLNIKIKMNSLPENHYLPVYSNSQIKTYLSLKQFNNQIQPLTNLVSRYVNYDYPSINNILYSSLSKKSSSSSSSISEELTDIDIYNKFRENKKIKDPSKKEKRNFKRAREIFSYINNALKKSSKQEIKSIGGDQYCHLDYGGNDGSVASEFAKLSKLDKTQVYSADIESWLGNTKNNKYENITYTLLNENQKLPYPTNNFDSISCLQVLHHLEFINAHLNELYRVLKPGGILVIREHDCINESTQFLIDIEHMIHEYVEPDVPNTKILKTYSAFYKSFTELNKLLETIGFEFVLDDYDFNPKFNPTRYYFAIYKKK
jgi:ubiquinone/menaquinone biosynthesis C-methylase UbiE